MWGTLFYYLLKNPPQKTKNNNLYVIFFTEESFFICFCFFGVRKQIMVVIGVTIMMESYLWVDIRGPLSSVIGVIRFA